VSGLAALVRGTPLRLTRCRRGPDLGPHGRSRARIPANHSAGAGIDLLDGYLAQIAGGLDARVLHLLRADPVNEQAMSLFTHEPEVPHRFLNPWIIRVAEVVEHHKGPLSERRTPRFNLIYGAFPVVGAIDVE
jgi:hypothetical protein